MAHFTRARKNKQHTEWNQPKTACAPQCRFVSTWISRRGQNVSWYVVFWKSIKLTVCGLGMDGRGSANIDAFVFSDSNNITESVS